MSRGGPDKTEVATVVQRVFLVEDQKRMEGTMADLFRSLGGFALIGTARTEAEACLWLDENAQGWDLAVIDLMLDQGTGIGVIARCRQRDHGKVVVLSSYASPAIRRHCLALGADAVFEKSDYSGFVDFCSGLSHP